MNLGKAFFFNHTQLGFQSATQHTILKTEQAENNIQALSKALNVKDKDQHNKKESETTWNMQRM